MTNVYRYTGFVAVGQRFCDTCMLTNVLEHSCCPEEEIKDYSDNMPEINPYKGNTVGKVDPLSSRRGGAASLYAVESRHFGTRTNPGKLATVKKSTFIRIAGFRYRTIVGPRFG